MNIHRPSVICLQETRLQDQPDPTVLKHYHPYRRYEGHGVAIYIHKTLTQTEVTLNTPLEAVACRVRFNNTYLAICSLYLPPNAPIVDDDITSLISQLPGNRLVLGDFNAHHQQWGSERSSVRGEQIVDIMLQTNLCLLNDGSATRVDDRTGNASAIDLSLLSPAILPDFSWEVIDDSHGSDHLPICISYSRDLPSIPTLTSSTSREQIGQPSVGLPTWIYLARTLTRWSATQRDPYYTPPRLLFRKLLQFTLSMEFHGGQRIADKHFVSVIGDTGISASSPVKQIPYKKARGQTKKVINNGNRISFRQFTFTVNHITG